MEIKEELWKTFERVYHNSNAIKQDSNTIKEYEQVQDELDYYQRYLETLFNEGKTNRTIEDYSCCIADFLRFMKMNHFKLSEVDGKQGKAILSKYLGFLRRKTNGNEQPLSEARIKKFFSALSSFYGFLWYDLELVENNIIPTFRERKLKTYRNGQASAERRALSVREAAEFIKSISFLQDKTINMVLVCTGIRRNELIKIDVDDIDLENRTLRLKTKSIRKRQNTSGIVFFSEECKEVLKQWMLRREQLVKEGETALFLNDYGSRITKDKVTHATRYWATKIGLHKPDSPRLEDHFTPHNLRHTFTTLLREAGMQGHHIEFLRGDSPSTTKDLYTHPDLKSIKHEYDAKFPFFGI